MSVNLGRTNEGETLAAFASPPRSLRPFSTLPAPRFVFSRAVLRRRDGDIDSRRTDDCVAVIRRHLIRRRSEHLGSRQCASSAKILMFLNVLSRDDAPADISERSLRVASPIHNISTWTSFYNQTYSL